jgi:ArsR family transcriptional regulator
MNDAVEVARLLDILGNRNRRRIIDLLRQKPCFVTEISETLMLSPKAVIEHLQMMEREAILSCQTDDRRRKYYYLANDISIEVSLKGLTHEVVVQQAKEIQDGKDERLRNSVLMIARMIRSHDQLLNSLEQINHDIETKFTDIAHNHSDIFQNERELSVIIALSHDTLTTDEIASVTGLNGDEIASLIKRLERRGIVERSKGHYMLRGVNAE